MLFSNLLLSTTRAGSQQLISTIFTINTCFTSTSFIIITITMIFIMMITRSDMQRERARERIDRARRQWELEHGKLDHYLNILPHPALGGCDCQHTLVSQLLAFTAKGKNTFHQIICKCRWFGGSGWKWEGSKGGRGLLANDAALWCRCSYHGQIPLHNYK